MKYVLSWRSPTTYFNIRRRKWWRFWEQDQLVEHHVYANFSVLLEEHEANRLQELIRFDSTLIRKLMSRSSTENAHSLQLEIAPTATAYVTTSEYVNLCDSAGNS